MNERMTGLNNLLLERIQIPESPAPPPPPSLLAAAGAPWRVVGLFFPCSMVEATAGSVGRRRRAGVGHDGVARRRGPSRDVDF